MEVYVQGGVGWYHLEMDALYSGLVPGPEGADVEKRIYDDRDGLALKFEVLDEAFMVAGLQPGALQDTGGMVQFSSLFNMH